MIFDLSSPGVYLLFFWTMVTAILTTYSQCILLRLQYGMASLKFEEDACYVRHQERE